MPHNQEVVGLNPARRWAFILFKNILILLAEAHYYYLFSFENTQLESQQG